MLTISRKVGETIEVEGGITIVVKEIRRHQVRIGVAAPRNVEISRGEIADVCDVCGEAMPSGTMCVRTAACAQRAVQAPSDPVEADPGVGVWRQGEDLT